VPTKLGLILIFMVSFSAFGQMSSSKYQAGTITTVTAHRNAPDDTTADATRYDVTVKIGNTLYVVLYTAPYGANIVEYSPGIEMLFLVGSDTLTFNSRISGTTTMPILRRETLPPQKVLDWSKAPGRYFNMKEQHLTEALDLSEDQQAQIKPALEQESGEVGQILRNPVLTSRDKLRRYEKIVEASDTKIKPILSQTQVDKLLELRKLQKVELRRLVEEQKGGKHN